MTDSKSLINELDVNPSFTHAAGGFAQAPPIEPNGFVRSRYAVPVASLLTFALFVRAFAHLCPSYGLGIHENNVFPALQPSETLIFGPFSDSVQHIEQNETAVLKAQDVWMYKSDSTSIVIRAYVEFFQLEALSPCLRYQEPCAPTTVTSSTIFCLLDSLVGSMARRKTGAPAPSGGLPTSLALRTTSRWIDQVHDFILPGLFGFPLTHTNQTLLHRRASKPCEFPVLRRQSSSTLRFRRLVGTLRSLVFKSSPRCNEIGRIWEHMVKREQLLRRQYASNMSLDMLVLENQEDYSKPALSFHSRKKFDITVITRVRNCTVSPLSEPQNSSQAAYPCATITVDDYRYVGVSVSANGTGWYTTVALLRCIGQSYMRLHVALLSLGCFYARSAEPRYLEARLHTRIAAAVRTVFLIPSQVVAYGSVLPTSCYVLAHLVDSTMVYKLVSQQFTTALSVLHLNFHDFMVVSAVSMRSVWIIALMLHVLLFVRTRCNRSPVMKGVPGVPELSITFLACLTIMAQFRPLRFRDACIQSVSEVISSQHIAAIRAHSYHNIHSMLELLFFGNMLDAKCSLAAVLALCLITLAMTCGSHFLNRIIHAIDGQRHIEIVFWPTTLVSYAAGLLWSANSLIMSWADICMSISSDEIDSNGKHHSRHHHVGPRKVSIPRQAAFTNLQRAPKLPRHEKQVLPSTLLLYDDANESSRLLQHGLAILDQRSRQVESIVYLMNLAARTDPLVPLLLLLR